jgi:hypothetical protein
MNRQILGRLARRTPILGKILTDRDVLRATNYELVMELAYANVRLEFVQQKLDAISGIQSKPKEYLGKPLKLAAKLIAHNKSELLAGYQSTELTEMASQQKALFDKHGNTLFLIERFCLCCNRISKMRVAPAFQYADSKGNTGPNWRETVTCTSCNMNNRQRLVARLLQQSLLESSERTPQRVYFMEQVTPIFAWAKACLKNIELIGSEYLGPQYAGAQVVNGIRHEDVMNLSFEDNSVNFIISNDVFEHVPDPKKAFRECARILAPGGVMLATIPFGVMGDVSRVRATLSNGAITHLVPPEFHGNPLSMKGSLVFHDYGWDLMDTFIECGFAKADCELYYDHEFGHFGEGLLIFRVTK